ncbi:GNAT family N-acetyltransferase [Erwiniaceae bacterium BAC15a-03b]|uniref:GNAT family N-acetyltransferase n=1 Tax=Winslowiella arboricola TaxID=2978220 RepID=A0A9J6PRH7_9GAMM|nr:GNAT family N-acetyltransferase [Winslowiella arboricola]MCU5775824.1 GNAT family N-acetyltransferase [Winslowiella arboricola]MCU5779326.1 GNAT family N-acetyltransferase [Winslowiella arboricola]
MLREMQPAEFAVWQQLFIEEYAGDLRANSGYSDLFARQRAQQTLDNYLEQGLETARQVLLCIEAQQQVVGYLWYQRDEQSAYIQDFLVLPAFRGAGYGRQALRDLEVSLQQQGVVEIRLRVAANNPRAKALYEACQFQITGYNMSRMLTK